MIEALKRFNQQHWTQQKAFDRLIYGTIENSRISIDSFRALDTTDILYSQFFETWEDEQEIIEQIYSHFLLNRIAGGVTSRKMNVEQFAKTLQLRTREMPNKD
jgi:hypothetical protein